MDLPDSPEGVALFLLLLILTKEPATNQPIGRHVLDLFVECLRTTMATLEDIERRIH